MQRISITINDKLKRQLDMSIPKGERASFVTKAIANELDAQKKCQAVTMLRNFKRYKVDISSTDLVREIRKGRSDYMAVRHDSDQDNNSDTSSI